MVDSQAQPAKQPGTTCLRPCSCRQLLGGGAQQRQRGLDLCVRFAAPLLAEEARWQGAQHDPAFWQLARSCLGSREAAERKRAAHLLRLALERQQGGERGREGGRRSRAAPRLI